MSSGAEYVGCAHEITAKSSLPVTNRLLPHQVSFGRFNGGRLQRRDTFGNSFAERTAEASWAPARPNLAQAPQPAPAVGRRPIFQQTFVSSQPVLLRGGSLSGVVAEDKHSWIVEGASDRPRSQWGSAGRTPQSGVHPLIFFLPELCSFIHFSVLFEQKRGGRGA